MATRRLAMNTALRGGSSRAPVAPRLLRASFSTILRTPRIPTTKTATILRPQLTRRTVPASIRWSSDSAPESSSRIWSFEEINKTLTSPPSNPKVKATLIDAREPSELAQTGRIPGALNIPVSSAPESFFLSADEFYDRYGFERPGVRKGEEGEGGEEEQLVFYCKAGVRSRAAATLAREAGYTNIGEYPGSWLDWVEKGGKIER
ncbi:Rhodanese-like protein [Hypoxylon trugodes]|uniref:Rhodanese-like protein n=1 Tax=Hypoxylon trugodes TaxID=326681 RepID=UPI0021973532|nr:Rhodanese-like protein [Hypoxylon trugodes]KAI1386162.1 Rhodanese-like protein [Hypoxylon trugodes]